MSQHKSSPAWPTLCCNYKSMSNGWERIILMMHFPHCNLNDYSTSKPKVQDVCKSHQAKQFVLQL